MKIRIRRIMIPVLFCLAVACLIEIPMGQTTLFGEDAVLWDTLFRAVAAVPVLMYFYREDQVFRDRERWNLKIAAALTILAATASAFGSFMIRSAEIPGYEAAESALLSGSLWLQILVLLVASPLLEEYFFRGVLYQRLKELVSPNTSRLVTAVLFGLFHGNLAQGIYGFFMGLFLAWAMEKCQTVKAPILIHGVANGVGILFTLLQ